MSNDKRYGIWDRGKTALAYQLHLSPRADHVLYYQARDGAGLRDLQDNIDISTFERILDLDDDSGIHEFSRSVVFEFFEQTERSFARMDDAL